MDRRSDPPSIERIGHPGGSPEGTNSTYVLPDRGLVLDPGPPRDASWTVLTEGLSAAGLSLASIETVVVTHWHADHAGVAPRLAAEANAELILHDDDAPLVGEYGTQRGRRVERDVRRLREWGVPDSVLAQIKATDEPSPMPDRCPVRSVTDGERIDGVEFVHTPGHTAGHLAIEVGDALLLGDAVLPTYTPNVGGSDTRMDDPLSSYLRTLDEITRRFERLQGEWSTVRTLPGHGPTVELPSRIETIRTHHAERLFDVVDALSPSPSSAEGSSTAESTAAADAADDDPDSARDDPDRARDDDPDSARDDARGRTPWAVARALFGEMTGIHAKMGAGEAAAHLRFAAEMGFTERVGTEPDRYVRTDTGLTEAAARRAVSSRY
ncbi:MBL fold metallo-hydrolase [Halobellus ordinarius]|uniref:MBL fold metallo-hydrolase n=1 Tax=Halobellus ordinarius TaxID=3075120 RepID=UPI002880579B|nr:MBL fold metallo-hydrolase [Halobellus sp. ZY16]